MKKLILLILFCSFSMPVFAWIGIDYLTEKTVRITRDTQLRYGMLIDVYVEGDDSKISTVIREVKQYSDNNGDKIYEIKFKDSKDTERVIEVRKN